MHRIVEVIRRLVKLNKLTGWETMLPAYFISTQFLFLSSAPWSHFLHEKHFLSIRRLFALLKLPMWCWKDACLTNEPYKKVNWFPNENSNRLIAGFPLNTLSLQKLETLSSFTSFHSMFWEIIIYRSSLSYKFLHSRRFVFCTWFVGCLLQLSCNLFCCTRSIRIV